MRASLRSPPQSSAVPACSLCPRLRASLPFHPRSLLPKKAVPPPPRSLPAQAAAVTSGPPQATAALQEMAQLEAKQRAVVSWLVAARQVGFLRAALRAAHQSEGHEGIAG